MGNKNLYGKVSEDFIEMLSEMYVYDKKTGQKIPLKTEKGEILTDDILNILGFHYDFTKHKAVYELLTGDVKFHRDYDSDSVYVRNQKYPNYVRKMKVYCGSIRDTYRGGMESHYKSGEIITSDNLDRGEWVNILTVGSDSLYRSSPFTPTEYKTLEDNTLHAEDDQ